MYRPSRLRWAADKWGTNPCCCGSRTGTCGHNHRTSQHAHLSDVARKKWSGVKKKMSGRSRQEEVVVRKLFTRKCVKTKIVLIVEVNCTDKKTTEQETPQHARRHLHPMNATSTSRSWHTTHLCEKLGYTGGVWLHKCRLNKCAARKCFNHNRYRFVWWASNNLVFGAYLKNTPQPHQLENKKISAEHSTTFENHQVS